MTHLSAHAAQLYDRWASRLHFALYLYIHRLQLPFTTHDIPLTAMKKAPAGRGQARHPSEVLQLRAAHDRGLSKKEHMQHVQQGDARR